MDKTSKSSEMPTAGRCWPLTGSNQIRFFINWTGLHLPPHGKVRLGGRRQHSQHTWPWLSLHLFPGHSIFSLSLLSPLLGFCALSQHLQQVLGSQLLFLASVQGQAGVGKSLWLSARTISQQTSPWPITRSSWFTGQLCLSLLQHQRCAGTHTNEERAYDALCHQPRVTWRWGYCGFTKGRSSKIITPSKPHLLLQTNC